MVRIDDLTNQPEPLPPSQRLVLKFLETHADYVFTMSRDDVFLLAHWLQTPDSVEPPRPPANMEVFERPFSESTVKWALHKLYKSDAIAAVKFRGRRYYGSKEAIWRAHNKIDPGECGSDR